MNRNNFSIDIEWVRTDETPSEVGDSSGDIRIKINDWLATRHYDLYSKTMRETAAVSGYPMALWLAYNWWRLLYEPLPFNSQYKTSCAWRSAHDLSAAGGGFVWPPLRFVSNGTQIFALLPSTKGQSFSDIQYDLSGSGYIERDVFEKTIAQFIGKVIARLECMDHRNTELHALWGDVQRERSEPGIDLYRSIEACLGYDPDNGPAGLIERLVKKAADAGREAMLEIAAAFSAESLTGENNAVERIFDLNGNGLPAVYNFSGFRPGTIEPLDEKPWDAGHRMAQQLRQFLNFGDKAIATDALAGLFELTKATLDSLQKRPLPLEKLSLGIPDEENPGHLKIYLHLNAETGQRFYLARILGDHLLNKKQPTAWLPATAGRTWRQKFQRAFATEFLCPLDVLEQRMIPDDPDQDTFEATAVEYGLDYKHLLNHWDVNHPLEWSDLLEYARNE